MKTIFSMMLACVLTMQMYAQDTISISKGYSIDKVLSLSREPVFYDALTAALFSNQLSAPDTNDYLLTPKGEKTYWKENNTDEKGNFAKPRSGYLHVGYEATNEEVRILHSGAVRHAFINGVPRAGDYYAYGWGQMPVLLKKGRNDFYFCVGRGNAFKAIQLVKPPKSTYFLEHDQTLPNIIIGEEEMLWGATRIMNATNRELKGMKIECSLEGETAKTSLPRIVKLGHQKVNFQIPAGDFIQEKELSITLTLVNAKGKAIDKQTLTLHVKAPYSKHIRTHLSHIDKSVQYYAVTPPIAPIDSPAMMLSVHGAGVEGYGHARAYKQKDWLYIVSPNNRRKFGFDWEDWGRWDAMEAYGKAKKRFNPHPLRRYLSGHSMGGHGTWQLGVTFPDEFAAIAPCSGYPDLKRYALDKEITPPKTGAEKMFARAGHAGRTVAMKENYKDLGVVISHGSMDKVVWVNQARYMRNELAEFHDNFYYKERRDGRHWYGVDHQHIFDFMKINTRPVLSEVDSFSFITACPGVSAVYRWAEVYQQEKSFEYSRIRLKKEDDKQLVSGHTENVEVLCLDLSFWSGEVAISLDGQKSFRMPAGKKMYVGKKGGQWQRIEPPSHEEKNPQRYGSFKDAFKNDVIFVYPTKGTSAERTWYYNKARFDAEVFWYRANNGIELIADKDFNPAQYADRNVIIYGNADNNTAWKKLLSDAPIRVDGKQVRIGNKVMKGDDLGCYAVYPRKDSRIASVGIVAGTGDKGMKSIFNTQYFISGTGFPDVTVMRFDHIIRQSEEIVMTGFFDNKWQVNEDDFSYAE